MTQTRKTRRVGRKRWAELTKFLTETMKTAQSERVRMAAAMRLADILTLREQRDVAELRAAVRAAGKTEDADGDQPSASEPPATGETAEQIAERLLESYRQKGAVGNEQ